MDTIVKKYAAARAPRYTSYPTAPHFQADFSEATYRDWLSELDPAEAISVYLHVPFCRRMCWYCGCSMKLARRYEPIADYVETMLSEIGLLTDAMPDRMPVGHIHWGGGTPTVLAPDDLARVVSSLRGRLAFQPNAELAIEIDPRTLTLDMTQMLGHLGFNRASLGVQEFDPTVQNAINRVQPFQTVADATEGLRKVGVTAINFDLMYGLPFQTEATLLATIDQAITLQPDRIALFGYAHVPWMAKNQRMIPEDALPGVSERLDQAQTASDRLVSLGYRQIGLDHFARPDDTMARAVDSGSLSRNFQGYTTDNAKTLIGVGASSISALPQGYVQNSPQTTAYRRSIDLGCLPIAKGRTLAGDDRLRRSVIERLMCDLAVDLAEEATSHGSPPNYFDTEIDKLHAMQRDGLVSTKDTKLVVTDAGRPMVRAVAAVFDAYLATSVAQHSKIA